jgi:hypothetical protein
MGRTKAIYAICVLSHGLAAAPAYAALRSIGAGAKQKVGAAVRKTSGLNRRERRQLRQALNREGGDRLRELLGGSGIALEVQRSGGALIGVRVRGDGAPVTISVGGNPKADLAETRREIKKATRRLYGNELELEPQGFSPAKHYAMILDVNRQGREAEVTAAKADPYLFDLDYRTWMSRRNDLLRREQKPGSLDRRSWEVEMGDAERHLSEARARIGKVDGARAEELVAERLGQIEREYGRILPDLTREVAGYEAADRAVIRNREMSASVDRLAKRSTGPQAEQLLAALHALELAKSRSVDADPARMDELESALQQGKLPSGPRENNRRVRQPRRVAAISAPSTSVSLSQDGRALLRIAQSAGSTENTQLAWSVLRAFAGGQPSVAAFLLNKPVIDSVGQDRVVLRSTAGSRVIYGIFDRQSGFVTRSETVQPADTGPHDNLLSGLGVSATEEYEHYRGPRYWPTSAGDEQQVAHDAWMKRNARPGFFYKGPNDH